jgi:hypothetical protein
LIDVVRTLPVLSNSKLPESYPDSERKTSVFQKEITDCVRRWYGWKTFVDQLCKEDVLLGYGFAGYIDQYEWRPRFFRQDECFVPNGSKQNVDSLQYVVICQSLMIHELMDLIHDNEAAEAAGWNIDNCVEAINNAKPEAQSGDKDTQSRRYEDLALEGVVGLSYKQGAKVIPLRHTFVKEANGMVSCWTTHKDTNKEIKVSLSVYYSMEDLLFAICFETGNGRIHGSKGLGRMLFNMHVAIERSRNATVDQIYLS